MRKVLVEQSGTLDLIGFVNLHAAKVGLIAVVLVLSGAMLAEVFTE